MLLAVRKVALSAAWRADSTAVLWADSLDWSVQRWVGMLALTMAECLAGSWADLMAALLAMKSVELSADR